MQGSLGEKIGEGVYADVHAWARGRVVKLFKPGVPMAIGWHEAQMTHAVFAAGAPAPQLFGTMIIEGRFAMVLQRLDGPTLLQLSRSGAMTPAQSGAILATLLLAVHKIRPPRELPPLRDSMVGGIRLSGDKVPKRIATGILALLERLSPDDEHGGGGLCHGDVHPDNVIMTEAGPRLIDWLGTARASAALDLACSHFLLSEVAPHFVDDPKRPRALDAAVQSEYARLTGLSQTALTAAIASWLPVVHVRFLFGEAAPALREGVIRRLEAALL